MLQKVVQPKRTYHEALDTCAAEGATLPKLLTAEDTLALEHYMDNENVDNAWTGLLKVNNTIDCTDTTCDGLLEWPGGPAFAFDASVYKEVHGNDTAWHGKVCFKFNKVFETLLDQYCTHSVLVICQFTPNEVPSDYELRNGKYYKVLDFI